MLALALALCACGQSVYHCADASACASKAGGQCIDGLCAFPSSQCASGYAFAELAGDRSGECAPVDESDGASHGLGSSSGSESGLMTEAETTSSVDTGTATDGAAPVRTVTGASSTSGSGSSEVDGSSGGESGGGDCSSMIDDFDAYRRSEAAI